MIDTKTIDRVIGATAYDRDGDKIGKVGQVYVDSANGRPLWASVHTGLFGLDESMVPLEDATFDGDELRVPYEKDRVKDAPRVDTSGEIAVDEQQELWRYYGLSDSGSGTSFDYDTTGRESDLMGDDRDRLERERMDRDPMNRDGKRREKTGRGTMTGDSAMTRSEEQLHVDKDRVETGRARLRKYVVTENQTVNVPVEREEVRLEREPITDANRDRAMSGSSLSEADHEVTLHEERVRVDKDTVPVERVRLDKDTTVENQRVSEDVRKEKIEFDKE
jgi:uncharacterized protein (TIGR02271 family)